MGFASSRVGKILLLTIIASISMAACTPLYTSTPAQTSTPTRVITLPVFPPTHTPAPSPTPDTRFEIPSVKSSTVTFWHPWTGAKGTALTQLIEEFNQANDFGLKIEATPWGGINELENAIRTQGETLPDILVLSPEMIHLLNGQVDLLNLLPYIESDEEEVKSDSFAQLPSVLVEPVRSENGVVGLPAHVDSPVLVYNQTWARELGFTEPPTTPEQFKDQVCSAARYNNSLPDRKVRGTGGWLEDDSILVNLGWLSSIRGDLPFTAQNTSNLESDQVASALQYVKDLSASGCSWKGKNPTPLEYFFQRKALVISLPADKIQAFDISYRTAKVKDEWAVIPYPHATDKSNWVPAVNYYVIRNSDDNAKNLAAWLTLKWLTSLETEMKLALSDGSLPATSANWQAVQNAGTMPVQLVKWMSIVDEPITPPYQAGWVFAREILQDGFYQSYLTTTTAEDIDGIITTMTEMLTEVEDYYQP